MASQSTGVTTAKDSQCTLRFNLALLDTHPGLLEIPPAALPVFLLCKECR